MTTMATMQLTRQFKLTVTHKSIGTTVCTEKRDKNIFRDIFYKTRAILMKFGTRDEHFKFHKVV